MVLYSKRWHFLFHLGFHYHAYCYLLTYCGSLCVSLFILFIIFLEWYLMMFTSGQKMILIILARSNRIIIICSLILNWLLILFFVLKFLWTSLREIRHYKHSVKLQNIIFMAFFSSILSLLYQVCVMEKMLICTFLSLLE